MQIFVLRFFLQKNTIVDSVSKWKTLNICRDVCITLFNIISQTCSRASPFPSHNHPYIPIPTTFLEHVQMWILSTLYVFAICLTCVCTYVRTYVCVCVCVCVRVCVLFSVVESFIGLSRLHRNRKLLLVCLIIILPVLRYISGTELESGEKRFQNFMSFTRPLDTFSLTFQEE